MPRSKVVESIETSLAEPLPDEVSAEEMELRHRRRQAEENRLANERLMAIAGMPMQRRDR